MTTSPQHLSSFLDRGGREPDRDTLARALSHSEQRFHRLVNRLRVGVFRADTEGRLIEANPALLRMLGYARKSELSVIDIERDLFVDARDYERLRARLAHGSVDRVSTRWRRRDGTAVTVRLSMQEVRGESGRVMSYDGIVDDMAARRQQQELLRRAERMASLGASLAGVAHELNNPLAAILGFAQLLLKKELDTETRRALDTINHEASRAGKIVRDLLTLARRRDAARRVRLDVNEVVSYIVSTRRYALETHGVRCLTDLADERPSIVGDRAQLEQVILNLLNNAEQAIRARRDEKGCVQIRTRTEGTTTVLEVEDDGIGIPQDQREHIWEAFWTTKANSSGTGIGLSVVRDIVLDHGGDIAVETGSLSSTGARFVVRFPGARGSPPEASDLRTEPACRVLDVLVIDPDGQSANFLTAFLTSRGHAALAAHDIEYAIRLVNHLTFDAILCDASLTDVASLAALREARGRDAAARVIIAAGDPANTSRLPLPLPPGVSLVMRPYDLEELRLLLED
jgi:PAS domain S-box-containing protein